MAKANRPIEHKNALVEGKAEALLLLNDLRDIRIEQKLTQRAVAEKMGLSGGSGSFISMMEVGAIDPKMSSVVRYAAALGVRFYIEEPGMEGD